MCTTPQAPSGQADSSQTCARKGQQMAGGAVTIGSREIGIRHRTDDVQLGEKSSNNNGTADQHIMEPPCPHRQLCTPCTPEQRNTNTDGDTFSSPLTHTPISCTFLNSFNVHRNLNNRAYGNDSNLWGRRRPHRAIDKRIAQIICERTGAELRFGVLNKTFRGAWPKALLSQITARLE
ncbi:hypothetical protein P280DRAFT_192691 [Massarina eburnea CBS 473.64]|uniref:Uncharacterized protein n=1 Tax=Massarina eburnea CBS 473.64 TaxID=1395130 RepID=A0A6A6RJU2_9PLEO|nr:hypothetical protein P280DRAFT_192691 [Massarina eburnea CBS 473.64]